MTEERRRTDRNRGFARAGLVPSLFGYVADVSRRGFRVVFPSDPRLTRGRIAVPVLSFSEIGVEPFPLSAEVRWVREKEGAWEIGFSARFPVPGDPGERDFLRIYEYYKDSGR